MNKRKIVVVVAMIVISGVMLAWKQFGLFFFVRMMSGANEPTLKKGEWYAASGIVNAKRLDFCLFKNINEPGKPVWIFRIGGVTGDTVEIRDGVVYINNENVDRSLTLSHSYKMRVMDTVNMEIGEFDAVRLGNTDSVVVNLPDHSVEVNEIPAIRYILPRDSIDRRMNSVFNKNWNRDHFGPVVVPGGAFFLLGDNRNDALDSRTIGWVKRENISGCLLFRR